MNTKIAAVEDATLVKEVSSMDLISLIFIFSPLFNLFNIIFLLFNIFSYLEPLNGFKSKNERL
jgi:hypothetical protein